MEQQYAPRSPDPSIEVPFVGLPYHAVHAGRRLRLLVFPARAYGIPPQVKPETSRFPSKEGLFSGFILFSRNF